MTDKERYDFMCNVMGCCKNLTEQSIIAFFYIYGMRPSELLSITKSVFKVETNADGSQDLRAEIKTAKTIKGGKYRVIILNMTTPFIDIIWKYIQCISFPEWQLFFRGSKEPTNFNIVTKSIEDKYYQTYGESICLSPYVFRKFRISYLLDAGANNADILAWKGGTSLRCVEESYAFFKPVIKFKNQIR
jgi:site-specific recombinase XerD